MPVAFDGAFDAIADCFDADLDLGGDVVGGEEAGDDLGGFLGLDGDDGGGDDDHIGDDIGDGGLGDFLSLDMDDGGDGAGGDGLVGGFSSCVPSAGALIQQAGGEGSAQPGASTPGAADVDSDDSCDTFAALSLHSDTTSTSTSSAVQHDAPTGTSAAASKARGPSGAAQGQATAAHSSGAPGAQQDITRAARKPISEKHNLNWVQHPASGGHRVHSITPSSSSSCAPGTSTAVAADLDVPLFDMDDLEDESTGAAAATADSGSAGAAGGGNGEPGEGMDGGNLDWDVCRAAISPPNPLFLSCSPPGTRKGAVLLDVAMRPQAFWEFEAVLVLLGGHWPARGLVSGRWPPEACELLGQGSCRAAALSSSASERELPALSARHSHSLSLSTAASMCSLPSATSLPTMVSLGGVGSSQGGAAGACGGDGGVGGGGAAPGPGPGSGALTVAARSSTGAAATCHLPTAVSMPAMSNLASRCAAGVLGPSAAGAAGPCGGSSGPLACLAGSAPLAMPRSKSKRSLVSEHTVVIHCGNVRQLARVVEMQEVPDDGVAVAGPPGGQQALLRLQMSPSVRAAAALLHAKWRGKAGGGGGGGGADVAQSQGAGGVEEDREVAGLGRDFGCLVRVRLRFVSRPEWLRAGARLIVRDRSDGHVAGAGCVLRLIDG